MEIIHGLDQLKKPFISPVVTLGNFDGVHLGHQKIFQRVREEASRIKGEGVVITFEHHPLKVLIPEKCPPLLTPFRKKMILMERAGTEIVLCIEFSKAFSEIPPAQFAREVLIEKVRARKIIVGYDYRFGKRRGGDAKALKAIGESFNVEVEVVPPIQIDGMTVSSSKIRELINEGQVDQASILLGKDYPIIGRVVEGSRRGHQLGFPTANLAISEELYPKTGVYAVEVEWRGRPFNGLANVGFNPTFLPSEGEGRDQGHFSLEVYILNFDQMIYGEEIEVRFIKRIREEVRFDTPSRLVEQIRRDRMWAEENVFRKRPSPPNESTWPASPI